MAVDAAGIIAVSMDVILRQDVLTAGVVPGQYPVLAMSFRRYSLVLTIPAAGWWKRSHASAVPVVRP